MKNQLTNRIEIDLDKFMAYLHKPSDTLLAIDKMQTEKLHKLIGTYDGIENVPEKETATGIAFQYNKSENKYELSKSNQTVPVNQLEFIWINFWTNNL